MLGAIRVSFPGTTQTWNEKQEQEHGTQSIRSVFSVSVKKNVQFIFRTSEPQVWLGNWCVIPSLLEFKEIICLWKPKHTFQYKNFCKHLHLSLRLIIHRQHY